MDKIFTLKEVAKRLRVTERTIFRCLASGKLNGSKIGHWRFTEEDLKKFLEKYRSKKN